MISLYSLASVGLAFFLVTASPGPANISNATIAMSYGRKTSLVYSSGLSFGLVFWGVVAASGMGAVMQSSLYALMALKIIGGLYLLWLAFLYSRSAFQKEPEETKFAKGRNWFIKGLLLNISNPKSVLAWMAALSIGLDPNGNIWSIAVTTGFCFIIGFVVNALYSVLFSVKEIRRLYKSFRHWVSGTAAILFTLTGFGLIRSAFLRPS